MTKSATKSAPVEETPTPSEAELAEQIGKAQRDLAQLEIESEELPTKLRDASFEGDAEKIVELRRRVSELPHFLAATKTRLERLRVARLEVLIAEADARSHSLIQAVEPAQEKARQANEGLREAQGAVSLNNADLNMWKAEAAQRKRNIDMFVGEASQALGIMR